MNSNLIEVKLRDGDLLTIVKDKISFFKPTGKEATLVYLVSNGSGGSGMALVIDMKYEDFSALMRS